MIRQQRGEIKVRWEKKSLVCLILALVLATGSIPINLTGAGFQVHAAQENVYSLNKTIRHLSRNGRFVLKVQGGAKRVKWRSTDKRIASVKKKSRTRAVVTGRKAGTCKIFAQVGETTLSCVVQVTDTTKKPGTFKNGVFRVGKTKIYTLKAALAAGGGDLDFKGAHYLYIGASRTKNTADAVRDPDVFFYSYAGCGIDCLFRRMLSDNRWKPPGLKVIDSFLKEQPTGTVLIDLGGNDLRNIKAYIGLYKTLIRIYPTADFRFIGILPRQDGTNGKRARFNNRLKSAFPLRVVDLFYFVLGLPEFDTVDGVHYAPELSRIVYEQTMRAIGRSITVDISTGAVMEGILLPEDEIIELLTDDDTEAGGSNDSTGSDNTETGAQHDSDPEDFMQNAG